jgi:hypothetical protein
MAISEKITYYDIPINDSALNESGFKKFSLPLINGNYKKGKNSFMTIWHEDSAKIIYSPFDRSSLPRSLELLQEKLASEECDWIVVDNHNNKQKTTAKDLVTYFENECKVRIDEKDQNFHFFNGKQKREGKEGKKQTENEIFLQRYTRDNLIAEAVIVGGRPKFAMAIPEVGKPDEVSSLSITLQDAIEIVEDNTVIKSPETMSYISKPYTFKSQQEFEGLVENVKTKNLDILYKKVKSIWQKYIDADDFHISLCAADTVFTYFQDKIGLTHYLFFVGGNDSGKSNNLTVFQFLGYRNMTSSGMTAANVYTFLGSGEEGLGIICEDEADNIDEDIEKMKVYKNGYTTGRYYHRIDTSVDRQQLKFNTFCFKAFAGEKLPDSVKAKGFNERTIELPCVYGFPQYDISEVANPAGEEDYEHLLEELNTMRNALLVYRLLHFQDKIPNIKLNIRNREKQLFKPILRIFQNTDTTLNELLPVVSKYINQKRESKANTLHAFLYRLVTDLIKAQNTYELESSLIWNIIKQTLQGKDMPYKPQSYDTVEFGIISQKGIVETLIQVFGSKPVKRHSGRSLIFDQNKLQKLDKIYRLSIDVKVGTSDAVADVADVADVGLDKHLNEQSNDNKMDDSNQESENIHDKTAEDVENITLDQNDKGANPSQQAPQAPQGPPKQKLMFECYHCNDFHNNNETEYERHVVLNHQGKPAYPCKIDLERLGLRAQGKNWEI